MSIQQKEEIEKKRIQQCSVLVVDDNELIRISVRELLNREGILDVATASSAGQALEKIRAEDYDIIVADYDLPDMNGGDLFRRIQETNRNMYMFLMSGKSSYSFFKEISELKISGFLSKPEGIQQMVSVLRQSVEKEGE